MTSDEEDSYDLLEVGLMEYLGLLGSQAKRPSGNVSAANDEPPPLITEYEYSEPWWDEYSSKWMCSVNEINVAKRRRDDDEEEDGEAKEPEEKYSKRRE